MLNEASLLSSAFLLGPWMMRRRENATLALQPRGTAKQQSAASAAKQKKRHHPGGGQDSAAKKRAIGDAREIYKLRYKSWSLGVGSHKLNEKERIIWLSDRTVPRWGIGCSICAAFSLRLQVAPGKSGKSGRRMYSTKWSRYEITSAKSVQASCLRKHSLSELHVAAFRALHLPLDALKLSMVSSAQDDHLLKGSVPQPEDWLQAWAMTKRGLSNRCASELNFTSKFITSARVDVQAIQRRAFSQMQLVMQSCIRRRKKSFLASASSVSLQVDDKKPYRLVRFKACNGQGAVSQGILCVLYPLKVLMESGPELWDEDKSQLAADSIAEGIKGFCTERGQLDEVLYQHVLRNCRSFTADGAAYAQKTGKLLRQRHCPNIILIFRDSAHMLRISSRDPLFCGEPFKKAWDTLFESDGVVPCLQYSAEWRARLATLNCMLMEDGTLGGILRSNLRHLGFAKQRWDSSCTPQRAFVIVVE